MSKSFLKKDEKRSGLYKLFARLCKTGTTKRKHGSHRTRTVCSEWRDQHRARVVAKEVDILNTKFDGVNCDINSNDLSCLRRSLTSYCANK